MKVKGKPLLFWLVKSVTHKSDTLGLGLAHIRVVHFTWRIIWKRSTLMEASKIFVFKKYTWEINQGISLFIIKDISQGHSFTSLSYSRPAMDFMMIKNKVKGMSKNIGSTNCFFCSWNGISPKVHFGLSSDKI